MVELFAIHENAIKTGDFPLNHDCILKVCYTGCGLSFQYFSCRTQDSGTIAIIIQKLFCVYDVKISSVEDAHLL